VNLNFNSVIPGPGNIVSGSKFSESFTHFVKVCIVIIKLRCKLKMPNTIYVTCEPDGRGSFLSFA
jgi:hypothetical protein